MSDSLRSHGVAACQTPLSSTIYQSLLKFMSIDLVMLSIHLILCHPLLLLPSIFPSISVFSNESALLISWPKYCSFSFSISPSNENSGLISLFLYLSIYIFKLSFLYLQNKPPGILIGIVLNLCMNLGSIDILTMCVHECSVASIMCDSLQPHELKPARLFSSWRFSRQEYWSGLSCSPPGDLPDLEIEHTSLISPPWQAGSLPLSQYFSENDKNESFSFTPLLLLVIWKITILTLRLQWVFPM